MIKEQVIAILLEEAEQLTGSKMPQPCLVKAHRWLYARPVESLPDSALWDDGDWLGACGDWCGGPRVEGALKSGASLAGRILGSLHENAITASRQTGQKQLSLFKELTE